MKSVTAIAKRFRITCGLLEAVGIKSYCAIVYGGFPPKSPDKNFPGDDPANHEILCVPLLDDTIWLECTSQQMPFDFLGDFTSSRQALLLTSTGGFFVNTPRYEQPFNYRHSNSTVQLSEEGNIHASVSTTYHGLHYDDIIFQLMRSEKDQREAIQKELSLPNIQLKTISYKNFAPQLPQAEENLNYTVSSYALHSGTRMFLSLNMIDKWTAIPPVNSHRRNPITVYKAMSWGDTVVYEIPASLKPEFLPDPTNLQTKFGSYHSEIKFVDWKLIYVRTLQTNDGQFPGEDYEAFREFYRQVAKADNIKISLVKNG